VVNEEKLNAHSNTRSDTHRKTETSLRYTHTILMSPSIKIQIHRKQVGLLYMAMTVIYSYNIYSYATHKTRSLTWSVFPDLRCKWCLRRRCELGPCNAKPQLRTECPIFCDWSWTLSQPTRGPRHCPWASARLASLDLATDGTRCARQQLPPNWLF